MKYMTAGAALLLTTTAATAGGIDRSGQFIGVLFEEGGATGSYAQLSFGTVSPDANSGVSTGGGAPGLPTGDPLQDYNSIGLAFKTEFNDQWSAALIFDEPFGTDVEYTSGAFTGGQAYIDSTAITAVLRYRIDDNYSVHGGVRAQEIGGRVETGDGLLRGESDYDYGFLLGAAYERPEIALRVALTYNSEIDNDLSGTLGDPATPTVRANIPDFTVTSPESLNLEFQTGIAEDTLLFGTIRHVRWDGYNLTAAGIPFANFTGNTTSYTVGIGRRLTDDLSVFATIGFEDDGVTPSTTALAPTTGYTSIGIGASYTIDQLEISGGVTYVDLGEQLVEILGTGGSTFDFDDNEAIGVGLRVGYNF